MSSTPPQENSTVNSVAESAAAQIGALREKAQTLGANATQAASEQLSKVREQASRVTTQAAEKARDIGRQGLDKTSSVISDIAHAAHDLGEKASHSEAGAKVGQLAHRAGERLDQYASRIRSTDVDDLISDARAVIRRHPAIAVGVAVAGGFLLARLLRNSAATRPAETDEDDYA